MISIYLVVCLNKRPDFIQVMFFLSLPVVHLGFVINSGGHNLVKRQLGDFACIFISMKTDEERWWCFWKRSFNFSGRRAWNQVNHNELSLSSQAGGIPKRGANKTDSSLSPSSTQQPTFPFQHFQYGSKG